MPGERGDGKGLGKSQIIRQRESLVLYKSINAIWLRRKKISKEDHTFLPAMTQTSLSAYSYTLVRVQYQCLTPFWRKCLCGQELGAMTSWKSFGIRSSITPPPLPSRLSFSCLCTAGGGILSQGSMGWSPFLRQKKAWSSSIIPPTESKLSVYVPTHLTLLPAIWISQLVQLASLAQGSRRLAQGSRRLAQSSLRCFG
jgi:hypothetical protein